MVSLACACISLAAGVAGLFAGRGRWGWATLLLAEMAGWAMLPALVAVVVAGVGLRWAPRRPLWRGTLGLGLGALALAGWPVLLMSSTAGRSHGAMRQLIGPDYPDAITAPSGAPLRAAPVSWREYRPDVEVAPAWVVPDICYRTIDGLDLLLDLYLPHSGAVHPLVVVIHGGGWAGGSRREQAALNHQLAGQGYAVAAVDYRLVPTWPHPAAIDDVRAAVTFLASRATQYQLDPARVVLLGRSAGGHLALQAGYTSTSEMLGSARIRGIVAYYAPTDLVALSHYSAWQSPVDQRQMLAQFLGVDVDLAPEQYAAASPVSYAEQPQPPTLLVQGARDVIVPVEQGRELAAQLEAAGNPVVYLELPWSAHAFDMAYNGLGHQIVLYELERFLAWAVARA